MMRPTRAQLRHSVLCTVLFSLMLGAGCDELPEEDFGARHELATLIAMLEPGSDGLQTVLLNRPLPLGAVLSDSSAMIQEAEVFIRHSGETTWRPLVQEFDLGRHVFARDTFPLAPGDLVEVRAQGMLNGDEFAGEGSTRIVSDQNLAFSEKPAWREHGYDADTLMFHDESLEGGFTNVDAFYLDWDTSSPDGAVYQYQVEFLAVSFDSLGGQWTQLPTERMQWLRDDEELAFQVGPYPDMRLPPGVPATRQPVSWGFFVFIDAEDVHSDGRNMGYYDVTLRRVNVELGSFLFSTHWWIREDPTDPVNFNLQTARLQGIVGSSARTSFRIAIVED